MMEEREREALENRPGGRVRALCAGQGVAGKQGGRVRWWREGKKANGKPRGERGALRLQLTHMRTSVAQLTR